MSLITKYKYLKIEELTENIDIKYITFNTVANEIKSFKTPNFNLKDSQFLIFDREDFEDNIANTFRIRDSINTSSFSCKLESKQKLLNYFQSKPTLNFLLNKNEILEEIKKLLKGNEIQSKKFYNNILKRLKYQNIELLFEKTDKQREDNFKKGIKKRDKELIDRKIKHKENEEKKGIIPNIKKTTEIDLNF